MHKQFKVRYVVLFSISCCLFINLTSNNKICTQLITDLSVSISAFIYFFCSKCTSFICTLSILKGRIVSERGDNSFKMRCDTLWHSVTPAFVSGRGSQSPSPPPALVSRIFPRDYRVNDMSLPPSLF